MEDLNPESPNNLSDGEEERKEDKGKQKEDIAAKTENSYSPSTAELFQGQYLYGVEGSPADSGPTCCAVALKYWTTRADSPRNPFSQDSHWLRMRVLQKGEGRGRRQPWGLNEWDTIADVLKLRISLWVTEEAPPICHSLPLDNAEAEQVETAPLHLHIFGEKEGQVLRWYCLFPEPDLAAVAGLQIVPLGLVENFREAEPPTQPAAVGLNEEATEVLSGDLLQERLRTLRDAFKRWSAQQGEPTVAELVDCCVECAGFLLGMQNQLDPKQLRRLACPIVFLGNTPLSLSLPLPPFNSR